MKTNILSIFILILLSFNTQASSVMEASQATLKIAVGTILVSAYAPLRLGVGSSLYTTWESDKQVSDLLSSFKSLAVDFLAEDQMTDALAEAIDVLREKSPELNELSDKEIAKLIVLAAE